MKKRAGPERNERCLEFRAMRNEPRRGVGPMARHVVHQGDVTGGIGPKTHGQANCIQDRPGSCQN
eukprot:8066040-Lingulodinium_polyedra.AAC.1